MALDIAHVPFSIIFLARQLVCVHFPISLLLFGYVTFPDYSEDSEMPGVTTYRLGEISHKLQGQVSYLLLTQAKLKIPRRSLRKCGGDTS